ncbi:MAG: GspE/PulE family protein [Thermoleophilia bacterium]|nr:GspE/PulE family protein [Thermoleophilia bacterium]MDH4340967.1 GspE/PulE family protein [Thermoleophilia bacterium]MDH5281837.1 GspE/PulE family protein [Thermoleophilia bacterium]
MKIMRATTAEESEATEAGVAQPARQLATPFGVDETAELVLDLLGHTALVGSDALALVRGRAANGTPVTQALIDEGVATSDGVARMLAVRHHLQIVDLGMGVALDAAQLIPVQTLERAVAVPYALEDDVLKVAVADPGNLHAIDELRLATKHSLELGVASRDDILAELRRLVRTAEAIGSVVVEMDEADDHGDDLEADDGISDGPLVRLVNALIFQAAEENASDVHFEAQEDALVVRFRVDGVLREVQRIPKKMAAGVTTRLKVLAKLDIAERRKPQDGRLSLSTSAVGRMLDIRVATLPTVEGEKVVMRLLDKSRKPPTMIELGLSEAMRADLETIVGMPTGALLVTGPTGSGKSTTLYGCLAQINRPEINIITVEDPVEYRLTGVNQVQINVRAGLTFASSLRSILRSDPDVVMVGEIRDVETAKISIEAALTGHFVLSTLHTNDAPSTITRLGEMGVEPFLTGAAVSAVLAQRLARKLCTHCCEAYQPTDAELNEIRMSPDVQRVLDGTVFYRKKGCPRCNHTGYRGRIGVFQFLRMSEEIAALAVQHASRDEIARAATKNGMRPMWDDGLEKVASGLTSIEELARILS